MKEPFRVRAQYALRHQCCKTHKRPLPLPFTYCYRIKKLRIKLVIEISLYYDARSKKHQSRLVVPWLRQSVTGLLLWRLGFDSRPVNVNFVMNKMTLRQVFLQALQFYLVIIILPMLHTRSFISD